MPDELLQRLDDLLARLNELSFPSDAKTGPFDLDRHFREAAKEVFQNRLEYLKDTLSTSLANWQSVGIVLDHYLDDDNAASPGPFSPIDARHIKQLGNLASQAQRLHFPAALPR